MPPITAAGGGPSVVAADAAADGRPPLPEHLDVLIVGAGISGLGAAYYLRRDHPQRSYAIVEARGSLGGTWDLFRYPGVRSDSDLYTFGYEFRPWVGTKTLADGPDILAYLRETAAEQGFDKEIRYETRVIEAAWSSADARWTVRVEGIATGDRQTLTCTWLLGATGYYQYDEGFTPDFEGRERFRGQIIHPQQWPADVDYAGRRVVVIGSGATAITLIPALARTAEHVTMLQRTPTYVMALPSTDRLAIRMRRLLGAERAHRVVRALYIRRQQAIWLFCRKFPGLARRVLRRLTAAKLPEGYPVDVHFNPPYNPWDQRLCFAPGGDLFRAISAGTAAVVTGRIESFTEEGVRVATGEGIPADVPADIIVTATGLNVRPFGGIAMTVDGEPVSLPDTVAYKGLMLSGVPNFAFMIGYTNSSWTLKIGLCAEHLCRLLSHMDANGYDTACPTMRGADLPTRPFLDFGAGYIQRAVANLPRQGDRAPWLTSMNYLGDVRLLRRMPIEDDELRLSRSGDVAGLAAPAPSAAASETASAAAAASKVALGTASEVASSEVTI